MTDHRLATIHRLGRALLEARTDIPRILDELATTLTVSLCDGCSIELVPGPIAIAAVTRHGTAPSGESLATTLPMSSRDHVRGSVTVTRDGGSRPFDPDDLTTIEACIEYASLAVESALRFQAEQAAEHAVAAERERIARFQEEMLGIVGHDLRAPLGAILIGTEMLVAEAKNNPGEAFVARRIESSARRMARRVDQLLDMTRARLGSGIPVTRQRTRLAPLLASVIDKLTLEHPGTKLELRCDGEAIGMWDPDRLVQVASNLLGNALQFGLPGAPILVDVTRVAGATTIAVHNELRGDPLSPAAIATLFEPYRRGENPDHHGSGLGLGLYIVHEIVRAHGGAMAVESSRSGTTFRVVLPETPST